MIRIGNMKFERPVVLAPMEDVSDVPFRAICKDHGADIVYTEFTNCEAIARNVPKALNKISVTEHERPVAIQLYGSNGESLEKATEIAENMGPDVIDINCGCWVKKVANRGDGAGLLRDLDKFQFVVQSVMKSTKLPVTVKTRLGWDDDAIVIEDVARMLRDNGVQVLTIHCRTRCQGYTGVADWSWLPKIKAAAPDLPLFANGDIVTEQDVATVLGLGADGAMIGRGAIGNPWIFERSKHYLDTGELLPEPDVAARIDLCIRHFREQVAYRSLPRGVYSFRKMYTHYLKGLRDSKELRCRLVQMDDPKEVIDALSEYREHYALTPVA